MCFNVAGAIGMEMSVNRNTFRVLWLTWECVFLSTRTTLRTVS